MSAIISIEKIGRIIFFQLILLIVLPARELTLDAIFKEEQFKRASLGRFKWVPETDSYAFFSNDSITKGKSLFQVNLLTGDTTGLVSSENFIIQEDTLHITGFWFSPDGENLLLLTQERKQWRHSFFGVYYNYSISQNQLTPIAKGKHLRNIKYAPDSRKIAYVKEENNLYIFDILQHKEKRLTRDGSETILNGYRGWLYEEEFGSFDGYRWSPDSKNILFFREDQSHVKQFTYLDEKGLYPEVKQVYYPKAGEENPTVKTGVISIRGGRTRWLEFEEYEDIYFHPKISLYYEDIETNDNASASYKKQEGSYLENEFSYSLTLNKLNQNYLPTDGFKTNFSQSLPIYTDDYSISNLFEISKYSTFGENAIFSTSFFAKSVNSLNGKDVRITKRVFLPQKKLRGFKRGKLGPKDNTDFIGGNYGIALNFATTLPNILNSLENVDFSLFYDVANVWGVDYNSDIDSNKIRSSTGVAIDWLTPVGPLTFSFSQAITKASSDETEKFRFDIGTTF